MVSPFLEPPRLLRTRKLVGLVGSRVATTVYPGADENSLRILTYHRVNDSHPGDRLTVSTREFRLQMEELAEGGRPVVRLDRILPALEGREELPARAVAVTFDDGYRDNFDCALPILDELQIPATFFVATSFIGVDRPFPRYASCCDRDGFMSWEQVSELASRAHDIGGHGQTHRELAGLTSEDIYDEVHGCRDDIRSRTAVEPRLFCYPRGSESPRVRELVRRAGFDAACTVSPGANRIGQPPLGLLRTEISGEDGISDFRSKLNGAFDAWHGFLQRVQSWRHG